MANHSSNPAARTHERYEKAKRYDTSKRCFFIGNKAMTNLDSILKSRDITLPTKFRIVKAMVFPVIIYGPQRRLSTKNLMLSNCGAGVDSWESLGLQGDQTVQSYRKSTLNTLCKEWCWSWSSNTLATWCEEPTHWKRIWCWERLRAVGEGGSRGWDGWMASLTQGTQI